MKKQLLLTTLLSFTLFLVSAQQRVGIGTTTPEAKLHVAGSQQLDSTLQFGPTSENMPPMISLFLSGTQNKDRMVIAHSPAYLNWGLQYQDSLDKFHFLSGGTPVLTTDLGSWRVGIGSPNPKVRLDVSGTGAFNLATTEGDFRLGNDDYRLKMGVANSGAGAGDAYIASSHRLYLGAGNTLGRTQLMSLNNNARVGIGTGTPAARLQVVGDTFTTPVIQATVSYVGSSDVRGVTAFSKPSDGWGYGVEGTGGFIGGYFSSLSGTYTGTGFGVYGTASGTAGTRIGVYGTASGGTVNNWGGYFPTKTYASELRVGGEVGATGYVAAINGKLITTEIKILPIASWPGGSVTSITSNGTILSILSDGKTFTFNGTGGAVSSDARLKQDIVPLTNSLQKLMQLNGYSYRFKTKADVDQKEIGVLAQEVQKVFPEAVYTDDKGMYSVSYNALVPVLINAIKEQQAEIDELKRKLQQQQDLTKRLEKLEAALLKH